MIEHNNSQAANAVLMIRPYAFFSNPLTAESNRFQGQTNLSKDEQQALALREFDDFVLILKTAGVEVIQCLDTPLPLTPDAIFPNNWISFHHDGSVILYPMEAENRRTERRRDIIDQLSEKNNYLVSKIIDLSHHEKQGRYLEGTGSMVMDHQNQIIYACRSSRTDLSVLNEFAKVINYSTIAFDATDQNGDLIYHTNVMMSIGDKFAAVCLESIDDRSERENVKNELIDSGKELILLSEKQVENFAGNMLLLKNSNGPLLVMSTSAYKSLTIKQKNKFNNHAEILHSDIRTIEMLGGGSVRCMLAEIF